MDGRSWEEVRTFEEHASLVERVHRVREALEAAQRNALAPVRLGPGGADRHR